MRSVIRYDSKRDLQEVDQFGFVDLVKSVSEGFVPSDIGVSAESFDGNDIDPESLIGKPSDVFEAMRIQDDLANGIRKENRKDVKKSVSSDNTENS